MTTNILGPGHYLNTGETAVRPTPAATAKGFLAWFAQCDVNGEGGTNIDDLWLNLILASLRSPITSSGAAQAELSDDMVSEAIGRIASGAIFATDTGAANAYVLGTTLAFVLPKSYFHGMRLLWRALNTNTLASVVNVMGGGGVLLGSKKILLPNSTAISAGNISADSLIDMIYDSAADGGAGAFRMCPWAVSGSNTAINTAGNLWVRSTPGVYSFTVPSGVTQVDVELWGSGGAGGASGNGSAGGIAGNAGGGGGSGGYARKLCTVTPGDIITVTVAAGGTSTSGAGNNGATTSFGAVFSATGGVGGPWGANSLVMGGNGGLGVSGDLNVPGSSGGASDDNLATYNNNIPLYLLNKGGLAPGGVSAVSWSGTGSDGKGFGTGGAGASGGSNLPGGEGAPGLAIIRW